MYLGLGVEVSQSKKKGVEVRISDNYCQWQPLHIFIVSNTTKFEPTLFQFSAFVSSLIIYTTI